MGKQEKHLTYVVQGKFKSNPYHFIKVKYKNSSIVHFYGGMNEYKMNTKLQNFYLFSVSLFNFYLDGLPIFCTFYVGILLKKDFFVLIQIKYVYITQYATKGTKHF